MPNVISHPNLLGKSNSFNFNQILKVPSVSTLRPLIWFYTICLCPTKRTLGLNGLNTQKYLTGMLMYAMNYNREMNQINTLCETKTKTHDSQIVRAKGNIKLSHGGHSQRQTSGTNQDESFTSGPS